MQYFINVAVLASTYALLAIGYVLVYRSSRVLNLAHGELMMLAAYVAFCLTGCGTMADCELGQVEGRL
jgi:branched-chain amino acid transport system permease protein